MSACESCGGRAQLFICSRCETDLRELLRSLLTQPDDEGKPRLGLLEYLDDAAVGAHGRGKSLIEYTDQEPAVDAEGFNAGMTKGQQRLERDIAQGKFRRDQILAAGGINAKASRLRASVHATLSALARSIGETRGVVPTPQKAAEGDFIGPLAVGWRRIPADYQMTAHETAWWLSENAQAIACDEGAGEHYHDITRIVGDILRVINPPIPPRFCGPCPSTVDRPLCKCENQHPHQCGNRLMAKRTAIEVTCRQCGQTHNIDTLIKRLLADVDHWRFTVSEILMIMDTLGDRIPPRTFRRWRAENRVRPRGYRRPDGSIGLTRRGDADEPVYRLAEVRKEQAASIRHTDAMSC